MMLLINAIMVACDVDDEAVVQGHRAANLDNDANE